MNFAVVNGSNGRQPDLQENWVRSVSIPPTSHTSACPVPYIFWVQLPDQCEDALNNTTASSNNIAAAPWIPFHKLVFNLVFWGLLLPYQTVVFISWGSLRVFPRIASFQGSDSIRLSSDNLLVCRHTGSWSPSIAPSSKLTAFLLT